MSDKSEPRWRQIKTSLLGRLKAGEWKAGESIPGEEALAREYAVARMTMNRVIKELEAEGLLGRIQGSGTFVAPPRVESTLLRVRSVAEEIRERGGEHRSQLLLLESVRPPEFVIRRLNLTSREQKGRLFHSRLVHFENALPLQLEERWIRPDLVPEYLQQDFSRETPSEYLHRVAPLSAVDYSVTAVLPDAPTAAALGISEGSPCLKLSRLSFSGQEAVAYSIFWHPGDRYALKGRV
ncbi:MAG: hypothetical protein RL095_3057 [Verrucomicrobiota bacterium]|jgi:GntR family histidine utilization transcriptional repressor